MNPNRIGQVSESLFSYKVIRYGHIISQPIGDYSHYDFLVDNGNSIIKVQVKSRAEVKQGIYQFQIHREKQIYTESTVSVFAFHLRSHNLWYLIPFDKLEKNKKSIFIKIGRDYEEFRENWAVLNF